MFLLMGFVFIPIGLITLRASRDLGLEYIFPNFGSYVLNLQQKQEQVFNNTKPFGVLTQEPKQFCNGGQSKEVVGLCRKRSRD
ncbi:unnamed protein product [Arabidopsis halleri]